MYTAHLLTFKTPEHEVLNRRTGYLRVNQRIEEDPGKAMTCPIGAEEVGRSDDDAHGIGRGTPLIPSWR